MGRRDWLDEHQDNLQARSSVRYGTLELLAHKNASSIFDEWHKHYEDDAELKMLLRAATSPTTLASTTTLSQNVVANLIRSMSATIAAAAVLSRCNQLDLDGIASVAFPGLNPSASNAAFVTEAGSIPVRQLAFGPALVSLFKFAALAVVTNEIFEHSVPSIETAVQAALQDSVGLALDAAIFSSTPASGSRPAGILVGLSALTPSASTIPSEAMNEDLATLIGSVSSVGGNGPVLIVASPKQAAAAKLKQVNDNYEIFSSAALSDKVVIAIATSALVSAMDPIPRFSISTDATVHMEDTSPATLLGAPGSPTVVAAPVRALWQTNCTGLKALLEIGWAMRHPAGAAFMTNTLW
jgi:HK97 family phage major capsid protein